MHFQKLFSLCFMVIFFLTSCEKDDTPSNSIVKENFSAPNIISAKQHFDANIKLPQNPNNSFQKKANSLNADWNNSKVDVYKKTSTQDVDILYTPVYLNTQTNVKAFVASVEQNGQVDSKIFLMLYKKNPFGDNGLSTYTFIYGLDGKLENAYNLEDGLVVPFDTQSSNGTDQSSSQKTANTVDCSSPPIDGDFNDMQEFLEACNGMLGEATVVAPGQNTIDPGPFSGGGLISDGPTWPGFDGSPFDSGDPFNAGGGFHAVNPIPLSPNLVTADPISIALAIDAPLLSQEATFLKAQSIELLQAIADYLNMNKDRDSIDSRFQDQDISNDQVPNIKPEAQNLIHDLIFFLIQNQNSQNAYDFILEFLSKPESIDPNFIFDDVILVDEICDLLNEELINIFFKAKINELKDLTSLRQESGYAQNISGDFIPLNVTNGGHSIHVPITPTLIGYMHTHIDNYEIPDQNNDGILDEVKTIKIFSPADVKTFLRLLENAHANGIPIENVYGIMISSSGTYTLRFNGFITDVDSNFNPRDLEKTYKRYFIEYSSRERAFLKFLKNEIDAKGVSLYKIKNNGTIKRKYLNDKGKVDSEKCPQ